MDEPNAFNIGKNLQEQARYDLTQVFLYEINIKLR